MLVKDLIEGQPIVTIDAHETLTKAAEIMRDLDITGLPVIDQSDVLVGLITVGGLMHEAHEGGTEVTTLPIDPSWSTGQKVQVRSDKWKVVKVADVMVTDLVTVKRGDSVVDAAKTLIDAQVHRAIVLDSDGRLAGLVSTTDFCALVANGRMAMVLD